MELERKQQTWETCRLTKGHFTDIEGFYVSRSISFNNSSHPHLNIDSVLLYDLLPGECCTELSGPSNVLLITVTSIDSDPNLILSTLQRVKYLSSSSLNSY